MPWKERLRWIALAILPVELLFVLLAVVGIAFVMVALPRPQLSDEPRTVTVDALVSRLPADDAALVAAIEKAAPQARAVQVERLDAAATLAAAQAAGWGQIDPSVDFGLRVRWQAPDGQLLDPLDTLGRRLDRADYHRLHTSRARIDPAFGAPVAEPGQWLPARFTRWYLVSRMPEDLAGFIEQVHERDDVRVLAFEPESREALLARDPEGMAPRWESAQRRFGGEPLPIRAVIRKAERTDGDPLEYELEQRGIGVLGMGLEMETDFRALVIPPRLALVAQLGLPLLLLLGAALLLRWRRADFASLPPPPPARRLALEGIAALAVLLGFATLVGWLLPTSDADAARYADFHRFNIFFADQPGIAGYAFAIVLMPLVEELLFRKWMLGMLGRAMPGAVAVVGTAALFAAGHAVFSLGHAVALFGMGVVFGTLWWRTRSVLACWAVHAANNAVAVAMLSRMPGVS